MDSLDDKRYYSNDIIATAFEIFQTTEDFFDALGLLINIVAVRYNYDRITVGKTNVEKGESCALYSWTEGKHIAAPTASRKFSPEDFERLINSYDEDGATIIDAETIKPYSKEGAKVITNDAPKSVLYVAMYEEGEYIGAMSYVVYSEDKVWGDEERSLMIQLTKIISIYLARHYKANILAEAPEEDNDVVTGLISFHKFKERLEKIILGGKASTNTVIAYTDFEGFNHFNHRYGYNKGDRVLKAYADYLIESFKDYREVYVTRENADKFVLFMRYDGDIMEYKNLIEGVLKKFAETVTEKFEGTRLNIRCGVYRVKGTCKNASIAIDGANYARKQIDEAKSTTVCVYTEQIAKKQSIESEVINNTETAFKDKEFKLYLQPRFSVNSCEIVGAEALVRWQKKDGTILYPDSFVPIYEQNGTIVDLDFYMFEEVAAYLKKNQDLHRKQVPISVNASILHALYDNTADKYVEILKKYDIDPKLTEIELTETASVSDYDNVKKLYERLRDVDISTAMDDFGAGYSVFNMLMDIPITTVKIDRGFVETCTNSKDGIFFLQSLIKLIKGLGFHVVCEGIETDEQIQILRDAGCEEAQGYWFAKPMPVEDFEKLMYA